MGHHLVAIEYDIASIFPFLDGNGTEAATNGRWQHDAAVGHPCWLRRNGIFYYLVDPGWW